VAKIRRTINERTKRKNDPTINKVRTFSLVYIAKRKII